MNRSIFVLVGLFAPLLACGCLHHFVRPDTCDCTPFQSKGAKKLLEWAVCKKESDEEKEKAKDESEKPEDSDGKKKNGEKSGENEGVQKNPDDKKADKDNGKNGTAAEGKENMPAAEEKKKGGNGDKDEPEADEIATDRPDFTESSTTVGKGRIQLESGYTFIRDRSNGSRLTAHSYPEALLRIGMFAEWFELRLGQNFANERVVLPNGSVDSAQGAEDLYLGVKLGLTEQQECLPEMALVLQMTVPSGSPVFSAREVLPGINWLYGWDIIKDLISFGGSTQANRVRGHLVFPVFIGGSGVDLPVIGNHSFLEIAQSLTVNYTLTRNLGAYTEWFAFFPHSALDPDVGPQQYFDGGFTYKFTPNTQFDIRAGVGLNKHADDFFAGTGFSFRY